MSPTASYIGAAATYAYNAAAAAVKDAGAHLAGRTISLIGAASAYLGAGKVNDYVQGKITNLKLPQESAAHFLQARIQNSKKLNKTKKSLVSGAIKPLVRGLKWMTNPQSFQSLVTFVGRGLANYTQTLRSDAIQQMGDRLIKASASGDSAKIKEARATYRDTIAHSLGFKSYNDLKIKTLRIVRSNAGHFVSENVEKSALSSIVNFFRSIYRSIIGRVAGVIVKKEVMLLGRGLSELETVLGRLSPITTEEQRQTLSLLINAQADVFALYSLHSLMQEQKTIKRGDLPPEGVDASLKGSLNATIEQAAGLFYSEGPIQREGVRLAQRGIEDINFETATEKLHEKFAEWLAPPIDR